MEINLRKSYKCECLTIFFFLCLRGLYLCLISVLDCLVFFMCDQITSHKINQVFGPAQIALLDEEYEWVQRFLRIKDKLQGGKDAKCFFCLTFTDIRSSIASHISVFSRECIILLAFRYVLSYQFAFVFSLFHCVFRQS